MSISTRTSGTQTAVALWAVLAHVDAFATAAEPERIEVAVHLDRVFKVPHKVIDPETFIASLSVKSSEPLVATANFADGGQLYIVAKKVGRTRLTATIEGKGYAYDVDVVEKLADDRPEIKLGAGETQFIQLSKTLADGPLRPLLATSNPAAVNIEFMNSRQLVVAAVAPGVSGLTIINAKSETTQYRITVSAEPPAENPAKPALSMAQGEALILQLPKPIPPDNDGAPHGPPGRAAGGQGVLELHALAADQVLIFAMRPGHADVSLVTRYDNRQVVERRVRVGRVAPLADSPRHRVLEVSVGKTLEVALPEGFRRKPQAANEEEDAAPPPFDRKLEDLVVLNPAVVSFEVQNGKLRLAGKQAGFTDIAVFGPLRDEFNPQRELLALLRVRVK
jgi:hypothetical protein